MGLCRPLAVDAFALLDGTTGLWGACRWTRVGHARNRAASSGGALDRDKRELASGRASIRTQLVADVSPYARCVLSSTLFDRYIMVDWSASNRRNRGKDSIWIRSLGTDDGPHDVIENPTSRMEARERIRELLRAAVSRRERVLVGFDFRTVSRGASLRPSGCTAPPGRRRGRTSPQRFETGQTTGTTGSRSLAR